MQYIDILLAIATSIASISGALLIRKINIWDKKAEDRHEKNVKMRVCELDYLDSVGTLAHRTASAIIRADIGNGDVTQSMEFYLERKHALEDCLREQNAQNTIK
jgi:hypothetical protein